MTTYDFSGSSNMEELRILLEETCMIRRLKSDVLAQLPAKQRQMVILDPALVQSTTKEMKRHAQKMGLKSLSSAERRGALLEWFNLTGKSKAKAVVGYLKDLVEGNRKFICFAHHQVGSVWDENVMHYCNEVFHPPPIPGHDGRHQCPSGGPVSAPRAHRRRHF